ncbi:MAG: hypothetical protein JXA96_10785 [Sedimentisphaerales bacterium]|nr:hypothetical protein [Sedimentisphaerales bacterium]
MVTKNKKGEIFDKKFKRISEILENNLSENLAMVIYTEILELLKVTDPIKKLSSWLDDKKRMAAINFDTIFDVGLKKILVLHFLNRDKDVMKLFEPSIGGPLVSLAHKARLLYAIGLISKTALSDFENIHKIRNEFAHSSEPSFEKDKIIKLVSKLSTAKNSEVTKNNSFDLFMNTLDICAQYIKQAINKELEMQKISNTVKKRNK